MRDGLVQRLGFDERLQRCKMHHLVEIQSPPYGSSKPPPALGCKESATDVTASKGMEKKILVLAGKLRGRDRNQHQQQNEAKICPILPVCNDPHSSGSTESSPHPTREGSCNSEK